MPPVVEKMKQYERNYRKMQDADEHDLGKSCVGKQRHGSKKDAKAVIRLIEEQGANNSALPMNAYRCKFCKYFHVGHIPARKRNR